MIYYNSFGFPIKYNQCRKERQMKLKLHENIKKFRKEKNLTQEKLAEILGVTVGAVSKWENGNNTPDIVMLTTLAGFFDVSVDVLLGYDMISRKVEDIVANIDSLVSKHKFEEAEVISRDAINRYPHDFSVIFSSAMIYHVKALENQDKNDARMAIDLFTKSLEYLSQNKNPDINDYVIRSNIAYNYLIIDEKAALERLKEINFGGINDTVIAHIYLQNEDPDQALNYSTSGIINHLGELIDSSVYMIIALAGTGQKKNLEESICLTDTMIDVIKKFSKDEIGCFSKYVAFYYVIKAYFCACIKDEYGMTKFISKGKKLAMEFDKNGSNDVARHLKFYHADKEHFYTIDSIGEKAVSGISTVLSKQIVKMAGVDKKTLNKIIDCWEKA